MGLRDRLKGAPPPGAVPSTLPPRPPAASPDATAVTKANGAGVSGVSGISIDIYQNLKHELHQKLIEKLDLRTIEKLPRDQLRDELRGILSQLLQGTELPLNRTERETMVEELLETHHLLLTGRVRPRDARPGELSLMVVDLPRGFISAESCWSFLPAHALFGGGG